MKFIYFKTIILMAVMLAISITNQALAVDVEVICNDPTGHSTPTETGQTNAFAYPLTSTYSNIIQEYIIPQAEIEAGLGRAGDINSLSLHLYSNTTNGLGPNCSIRIFIANIPWTSFQDAAGGGIARYLWISDLDNVDAEWQEVFTRNPFSYPALHKEQFDTEEHYNKTNNPADEWVKFTFDTKFNYTGYGIIVKVCLSNTYGTGSSSATSWSCITANNTVASAQCYKVGKYNPNQMSNCEHTATTQNSSGNYRPWIKFDMSLPDLSSQYVGSIVEQATSIPATRPNEKNIPVVKLAVRVEDGAHRVNIRNVVFDGKSSIGVITAAKLYYTGLGVQATNSFDITTATPVAELNFPNSVGNTNNFEFTLNRELPETGWHNFWLVYDIFKDSPVGDDIIDAKLASISLFCDTGDIAVDPATDPNDPEGGVDLLTSGYYYSSNVNPTNGMPYSTPISVGAEVRDENSAVNGAVPGFNNNMEYSIIRYPADALGNVPGLIRKLAFFITWQYGIYSGSTDMLNNVYIFMKNNDATATGDIPNWPTNIAKKLQGVALRGDYYSTSMFTTEEFLAAAKADNFKLVKGPYSWNTSLWPTTPPFYTVTNLQNPIPDSTLTSYCDADFWTEDITLDSTFEYTGRSVDVIIFKNNWQRVPGEARFNRRFVLGTTENVDRSRYGYAYLVPRATGSAPNPLTRGSFEKVPFGTSGNVSYTGNDLVDYAPLLRTYITYITGHYYNSPYSFKGVAGTSVGAKDANVKGVCVEITGLDEAPYIYLKDLGFEMTNDFSLVRNAKLYYTGADSAFTTNAQVGQIFPISSATDLSNIKFDFSTVANTNGLKLSLGKHYFWLACEVATNAQEGAELIAKATSGTVIKVSEQGSIETFDISNLIVDRNPESKTIIHSQMEGGIYTVGNGTPSATHYTNLYDLANDITNRGVKGDVTINVLNDIVASQPAVFGVSPSVANVKFVLQSNDNGRFTLTNNDNISTNTDVPVIWFTGTKNFTVKNLNLKREGVGSALKLSGISDIVVDNTILTGVNNVIDAVASQNFTISNSTLLGSSNYAINLTNGCANAEIFKNTFGSSTAGLRNGISIQSGSQNLNIYENYIHSLAGDNAKATVFSITGETDRQPLSINIMNNIINDIKATETASVFEISNASGVRIYHNSVIIKDAGGTYNVQIFNLPTNTNSLIVRNNLFSITAPASDNAIRHQFFLIADRARVFANTEDANNNIYNGNSQSYVFGRNLNTASTVFSLNDWKATGYELNSSSTLLDAKYTADNHIDGSVIGERGILCPVLPWPNADRDMDGQRGIDNEQQYQGFTTVGADETKINITPIKTDLPEIYFSCASSGNAIGYEIRKEFEKWADGVAREFKPEYRNYWFNVQGDSLTEAQGWRADESIQDPFLNIPAPNQENTCEFYCLTQIGYFQSKTINSSLAIIFPPYIPNLDDKYICSNNGKLALTADIEGTYRSWQWQKKIGTAWENTTHIGEGFYDVGFEEDFVNPAEIEGVYRLVLQPYTECGDKTPAYISNELKVVVGEALKNNPTLSFSHNQTEMTEGICANTQDLWLASGLPVGNVQKDIVSYQWYKKVVGQDEWRPVSSAVNSTATKDTFKLAYVRAEDAGTYRCQIIGIPDCGENNYKWSDEVVLNVNLAAEITQSPVAAFVCLGDNLINGFSIGLFEPTNLIGTSTFQWYKDGKPLVRLKDDFVVGTSRISLKTNEKTLSFENAQLSDGGEYQLEMTYINCDGNKEVLMTTPVYLDVKEETYIVSQSTKIYGVRGGYTSLEVVANTSGKPLDASVTYQWYRNYSDSRGAVLLNDNSKLHGTKTSLLTIINLTDDDITATEDDYYFCVVKDWCLGDSLVSQSIKLSLAPDINIDTQPSAIDACEGEDVTLTIAASSTDPTYSMSYQWFKEGTLAEIPEGKDKTTLTLENVTSADAATYYCVVSFTDLSGTKKQTNKAIVTIETKPVITGIVGPAVKPLKVGDSLRLEVTIANNNSTYEYEWYLNGFLIPNSSNSVYYVEKTTAADKGQYHCVVKSINGCGEAISDIIDVDVVGIIDNNDPFFHIESVLPNPVTNEAIVRFVLPEASPATLTLLDLSGRESIILHSGNFIEGTNQVQISNKLSTIANGTYFVILESKGRKAAMKITISK